MRNTGNQPAGDGLPSHRPSETAAHKPPDELFEGPVDCTRIQGVLLEYLDREMGPKATILVREHLRRCTVCQAEAASLASMAESLRKSDPAREAPSVLSEHHRRRIAWAWTHPVLAWCVRYHRMVSLLAVLLALLAVAFAMRQWRMNTPPPEGYPVKLEQRAPE